MDKIAVLKTKIDGVMIDGLKLYVGSSLKGEERRSIAKINAEMLLRALRNNEFCDTLENFDLNLADGRGVLWAAKYLSLPQTKVPFLGHLQAIWQMVYSGASLIFYPRYCEKPITENISGVNALMIMLKEAERTNSGVFLFGAAQNDLENSIKKIKRIMPGLRIPGCLNGYDWQNDNSINPVEKINKTDAKLLIVALGSPLQEYWIRDNIDKLDNIRVAVGEGGSLAFLAGTFKRAPKWIQNLGIEWLWRLFSNKSLTHQTGSRLKRVWNAVPVFIYETVKWKIKNG